jgi:hypothetical protein
MRRGTRLAGRARREEGAYSKKYVTDEPGVPAKPEIDQDEMGFVGWIERSRRGCSGGRM